MVKPNKPRRQNTFFEESKNLQVWGVYGSKSLQLGRFYGPPNWLWELHSYYYCQVKTWNSAKTTLQRLTLASSNLLLLWCDFSFLCVFYIHNTICVVFEVFSSRLNMQITIRLEGDGAQKILNFILIWGKKNVRISAQNIGSLKILQNFKNRFSPSSPKLAKRSYRWENLIKPRSTNQTFKVKNVWLGLA